MRKFYLALIPIIAVLLFSTIYCGNKSGSEETDGSELAHTYCATCHSFPDPALLDKITWSQGVLPKMAELMKVDKYYNPYNASGPEGDMPTTREAPENLFPYDRWEKIVKYYLETAPDSPMQRKEQLPPIQKNMPGFTAHTIYAQTNLPLSTVTRFDTARNQIILGDGTTGKVLMLDPSLHAIDSFKVGTGIADIRPGKNEIDLVTMGILKPSDAKLGQFGRVVRGKTEHVILDSLQRPVQITFGDLNADAKEDVVLCEFGYRHGGLSWLENEGDGHYKKHILRPLPGASNASIYDFDLDGKPDIAVLMTQADEGVFIYYNKGNGQFREERVLTFPPVYGSNSMELCDMNGDGIMDIITTNGDNADYSVILKAYHGIRIFINDGSNHFKEEKFLPVYGVQKVMAADLDNDGDLDLASVAFFPDYEKHPDESFIFWENTGNLNYNRFTFNGSNDGRWMTMDIGDMDHDGDKDIIIGSALFTFGNVPPGIKEKWERRPVAAIVLENRLVHKKP